MNLFLVAHRALQNPTIFTNKLYKQAAIAVIAGIVIRLIIGIPVSNPRLILDASQLMCDRLAR